MTVLSLRSGRVVPPSGYQIRVMVIGFSTTLVSLYLWVRASWILYPDDLSMGRGEAGEWIDRTFAGVPGQDPALLFAAQAALVLCHVSGLATVVLAAWPDIRGIIWAHRRKRGPQLDLQTAAMDAPFWQVGDRVGWYDDANKVRTGLIEQAHRLPFQFGGMRIRAYQGAPGTVVVDDETGERTAHDFGTVYRVAEPMQSSFTVTMVDSTAARSVGVGDDFAWLDSAGNPVVGTVLAIYLDPFEIDGRFIDASPMFPGYKVKRTFDGAILGLGDDLRDHG